MSKLPVLLIAFLRLDATISLIEKLQSFGVKKLYIALDRGRNANEIRLQEEFLGKVEKLSKLGVTEVNVWKRKENLGLATSVVTAVDWFFENERQGVIIEDDLEFNEDFLDFCSEALQKALRIEDVWMVAGSNFYSSDGTMSIRAINYPMIWGWATTSEKWQLMRSSYREPSILEFLCRPSARIGFFWSGSLRANRGIVNTWDLPLAFQMLQNSKLCILPPVNLVSNIGVDSKSSHTLQDVFPLNYRVENLGIGGILWKMPLREEIDQVNKFYERNVFMIYKRHILSPLKSSIEKALSFRHKRNQLLRSIESVDWK